MPTSTSLRRNKHQNENGLNMGTAVITGLCSLRVWLRILVDDRERLLSKPSHGLKDRLVGNLVSALA